MEIEKYQRYRAVFQPARTDNLKSEMFDYIGREGIFEALWIIEEGEQYAGQWAMNLPREWGAPFTWCPQEDIKLLTSNTEGSTHRS